MTKSLGPPGGYGAITLMGLAGQLCAMAALPTHMKDATHIHLKRTNFRLFNIHVSLFMPILVIMATTAYPDKR
ncbi:MAG: hypothetical protein ACO3AC_13765 [Hylemonella sp.]|jgi:hypothetical protein